MPDTPTTAPGAPATPATGTVRVSVAAGAPTASTTPEPTPVADPAATPPIDPAHSGAASDGESPDDAPPDDSEFTSDRQKRRFAALSGRVTQTIRERDEARGRLEAVQWREVERLAGATLAVAADVRLEASALADLVDPETGDVDPARVAAVVAALVRQRPGLQKPNAPRALPHGFAVPERKPTFAEAIQELTRGII
jgi:hypothetical protein